MKGRMYHMPFETSPLRNSYNSLPSTIPPWRLCKILRWEGY